MIFSRVLAIGEMSAIGLYDVLVLGSLLCLGIGIILASFQRWGIVFVFSAMLYICVRSCMACGPRCFKCLMFMLSGPVELFVLDVLIAVLIWSPEMTIGDVWSFLIFLSMILFCLFVWCLI